jgi:hypothetical protein
MHDWREQMYVATVLTKTYHTASSPATNSTRTATQLKLGPREENKVSNHPNCESLHMDT